jgi:3-oxoacyl-[acyl-carrier protein] reductase
MNKVAIVTGSSRGLGRRIAISLAEAGWKVVIHYNRNVEAARQLSSNIRDSLVVRADVRYYSEVDAAVKLVLQSYGRVDLLVNNAGITKESLLVRTGSSDFDEVIDTNLKGTFNFTKAVSRQMMKQRGGRIVNISSYAGEKGREGLAAYSASKAAVIGFTMTAARELSRYGIMVNAVLPGYMMTDMGRSSSGKAREKALRESLTGNFSDPEQVADFIVRLSGMNGVTGQVFNLDSRIL